MKKLLFILSFMLVASMAMSADRSKEIKLGLTEWTPSLNASDTINEDDTVTFTITNRQKYAQNQAFAVGLTHVSGNSTLTVKAYGKITLTGSWTQIGSTITWNTASDDGTITSTSPINYNYLKVEFIADATDQQTKITTFELKTSNAFDIPVTSGTLTISRPTSGTVTVTTKDDDANAATVYRAGGTGALTLGASTGTIAITSSDWAVSATGAMTGIGAITNNGAITQSTDGDTLKLGVSTELYPIDLEIGDDRKLAVDSTGLIVGDEGGTFDNNTNNTFEWNENSDELIWTFGSNTVTISSGDVTAINYSGGISSTWSGSTSGGIKIAPIATGTAIATIQNQNVSASTITLPLATCTLPGIGLGNTWTGANIFTIDGDSVIINAGTTLNMVDVRVGGASKASIDSAGNIKSVATVFANGFNFCTASMVTGSGDSISIVNASIPTLTAGLIVMFVAEAANTGAAEITLNGVNKNLYEEVGGAPGAMEANDIRSGAVIIAVYDGTQFVQISPSGN